MLLGRFGQHVDLLLEIKSAPPSMLGEHSRGFVDRSSSVSLCAWYDPLAFATVYRADTCPCCFMRESAAFRQMQFVNVMAV